MNRQAFVLQFICSLCLFCCQSNESNTPSPEGRFLQRFPVGNISDTLHIWREMATENELIQIPDSILQAASIDSLLAVISPYAEDMDGLGGIYAISQFPWSHHFQACLVQINYSWYRHLGFLLWEKDSHRFIAAVPLSSLDGGDGGQILTESWLFDWDGDGDHDQLLREHAHALIPSETGGDPEELNEDQVFLFLWEKGGFQPTNIPDTTGLIARFPIDW